MRRMVDDKEMITIDNRITALEQGGGGGGDAYTKAESDAKFQTIADMSDYVVKSIIGDDTQYGINYGSGSITPQLTGSDNSGSHPCNATVQVTYNQVHINANDYNHGDYDYTYTGSIDVTDEYVDIEATNGTNTTTLRVAPSGVTVNGSPIGGGGSTLYRHHIQILLNSSHWAPKGWINIDIINSNNTAINTLDAIKTILNSGTGGPAGYPSAEINATGVWTDGSNWRTIVGLRISNNEVKGVYWDTSSQTILEQFISLTAATDDNFEMDDTIFTL